MASWCWICSRKLKQDYVYYKGKKTHPKCMKKYKKKET